MSIVAAQTILRRLRSNGVKVWLRPRGGDAPPEVVFHTLENVPADLKRQVGEHALFIRQQLEDEALLRASRASQRRRTEERWRKLPDAPAEQL